MVRECFCEACDFDGMQTRKLIAGRFQLNCRGVSGEISYVGPVEHFDGFFATGETGGCESPPETLETYVGAGDAAVAGRLDDLNVVDANHSFAVNVDELFVEHVAGQQHFTFTTDEWTQIENVGIQARALLIQNVDTPAREKEIAASITRDQTRHRRMIAGAETHDDVLDGGDTFSFKVAYRPT